VTGITLRYWCTLSGRGSNRRPEKTVRRQAVGRMDHYTGPCERSSAGRLSAAGSIKTRARPRSSDTTWLAGADRHGLVATRQDGLNKAGSNCWPVASIVVTTWPLSAAISLAAMLLSNGPRSCASPLRDNKRSCSLWFTLAIAALVMTAEICAPIGSLASARSSGSRRMRAN
jgi:hypothetical protein